MGRDDDALGGAGDALEDELLLSHPDMHNAVIQTTIQVRFVDIEEIFIDFILHLIFLFNGNSILCSADCITME